MNKSTLLQGDCISILDIFIADGLKVDAVITSPPYNMRLRVQNDKYVTRSRKNIDNAFSYKYANYTDDLSMDAYYKFQCEFITKCLQVSDILFYNIQMVTGNKVALCQLFGTYAEQIKEIIIWNKCNAQPAMHDGVLNSQYEFLIVFQKSKPYQRMFMNAGFARGTESNVWDIKRERNTLCKAAFPTALVRRILKDFVPQGSTVLDPFMGSGTTGVVCKQLGYDFIGVELDTKTFESAKERIEQVEKE